VRPVGRPVMRRPAGQNCRAAPARPGLRLRTGCWRWWSPSWPRSGS